MLGLLIGAAAILGGTGAVLGGMGVFKAGSGVPNPLHVIVDKSCHR